MQSGACVPSPNKGEAGTFYYCNQAEKLEKVVDVAALENFGICYQEYCLHSTYTELSLGCGGEGVTYQCMCDDPNAGEACDASDGSCMDDVLSLCDDGELVKNQCACADGAQTWVCG
jgi:hypothetical protein